MIIPFFIPHSGCRHLCVFCNQKSITGQSKKPSPSFLASRIQKYLATDRSFNLTEVAFFGGTFTALPLPVQKSFLDAVKPFIEEKRINSVRISTRPDCITPQILDFLQEHQVKTIELGIQSMDDEVLIRSGRGHTASQSVEAAHLVKTHDFSLGLQLMTGLPGDTAERFIKSVSRTIEMRPDFVRLYPTLVIRDTPLEDLFRSGRYVPLDLKEAVSLCKHALIKFRSAGVKVIRIGLQPTEDLEKTGTIIAGPYHPAFRQLVESEIMMDSMRSALADRTEIGKKVQFMVNPADLSPAIGQKRSNIQALQEQFRLDDVSIISDESIKRYRARMLPQKTRN